MRRILEGDGLILLMYENQLPPGRVAHSANKLSIESLIQKKYWPQGGTKHSSRDMNND